ncbi:MAG TPA: helix-turn-helix domain-containing protein [Sphingobacteriaceae bacterium]|nr:helix-turn-helix domain-containing protein [Sphingobacteriaceae bacterium]
MDETSKWVLEKLGQRIRERREELHYSQKQIADMTGLSNNTISKIEQGNNLAIDKLVLVCQAIKIQPRDLFEEDIPLVSPYSLAPEEEERRTFNLAVENMVDKTDYLYSPRRVSEMLREMGQPSSKSRPLSVQLKRYCKNGKLEVIPDGKVHWYQIRKKD